MALQHNGTVFDLEEAELCYAPQFGSAKDPVNMAGMVAANVVRGDSSIVQWEDIADSNLLLIDVREPKEFEKGHLDRALNVPLSKLRGRMDEIPKENEILVYCLVGQRSYYASRILSQHGFKVKTISGGYKTYTQRLREEPANPDVMSPQQPRALR